MFCFHFVTYSGINRYILKNNNNSYLSTTYFAYVTFAENYVK